MTTPLSSDTSRLLLEGWAQYLAAANIGLTWSTTVALDDQAGVPICSPPTPDAPDQLVTLGVRTVRPDPTGADTLTELSVRARATNWRALAGLRDATSNVLLGLYGFTLPTGIPVTQVTPAQSSDAYQEDYGRRRWWAVDDYDVLIGRPTLHRNR